MAYVRRDVEMVFQGNSASEESLPSPASASNQLIRSRSIAGPFFITSVEEGSIYLAS
jgi:hypothetical protein